MNRWGGAPGLGYGLNNLAGFCHNQGQLSSDSYFSPCSNRDELNQDCFLYGSWRIIEFDELHVNGEFKFFNRGEKAVWAAVTRNMGFFEPVIETPPENFALR